MSNIISLPTRYFVSVQNRTHELAERGSATAEYGVTVLVAVAMALCVFNIVTGGKLNGPIEDLLHGVLAKASAMTK